jgi:hypothetical protein
MEEHTLRIFENRGLRRIFGRKRGEIIGCWRKLHNEELYNVCALPNIISFLAGSTALVGAGLFSDS